MDALAQATFSGRRFTRKQLAQVQETVRVFRNLSRKELAQTVCEHLDWRTPRGANKTDCCLGLLETMQERGLVTLPAKRKADVAPKHAVALSMAEREQPFSGRLAELEPIRLERSLKCFRRAADPMSQKA